MDRTLKSRGTRDRRLKQQVKSAWGRFSPDGLQCRYCEHDGSRHVVSLGQPHFFRPATDDELLDSKKRLYKYEPAGGDTHLVTRVTVARHVEIIFAFCEACAEGLGAEQVMCYQRTVGVGEVVGLESTRCSSNQDRKEASNVQKKSSAAKESQAIA